MSSLLILTKIFYGFWISIFWEIPLLGSIRLKVRIYIYIYIYFFFPEGLIYLRATTNEFVFEIIIVLHTLP